METTKTHTYPCASCGADLLYEPSDGFLTCPYCGYKQAIAESTDELKEQSFERHVQFRPEQIPTLANNALEVQCQSCGAKSIFMPPQVAGVCEFCGVQIVAQPKTPDPIISPGGVLPFSITQQRAASSLKAWLASRWFAPNALKQFAQPEAIHGIYLPFWTYDTRTTTNYEGQRGDHYWETEHYTERDSQGNLVNKTRQVRKTRWSYASGRVDNSFDDVLVAASKSISPDRLHALAPWDLQELKPYDPAYLSGFRAQRYQVELEEGFERAKQMIKPTIESTVRSDIGGDEQMISSMSTECFDTTFKHLLLPVYAGAYRFNGRVFQILVNGRTGEIQGERPYSFWKIAALVVFIVFVVLVFVLILSVGS